MKRVIITFLCLLCIVQAYSQSFTISGTIIDGESNEPLIGAGILVKGAGRGTITNIDGKYSLEVYVAKHRYFRLWAIKIRKSQ